MVRWFHADHATERFFGIVIAMELQQRVAQVGVGIHILGIAGNRLAKLLDSIRISTKLEESDCEVVEPCGIAGARNEVGLVMCDRILELTASESFLSLPEQRIQRLAVHWSAVRSGLNRGFRHGRCSGGSRARGRGGTDTPTGRAGQLSVS